MQPTDLTIKVPPTPEQPSGDALLAALVADLGAWGGMSYSTAPDAEGDISASIDPRNVAGLLPDLLRWLDKRGTEYTLTVSAWS